MSTCFYVIFYGIWRRRGINKEIRSKIFIKQTLWFFFRLVTIIVQLSNGIRILVHLLSKEDDNSPE